MKAIGPKVRELHDKILDLYWKEHKTYKEIRKTLNLGSEFNIGKIIKNGE